MLDKIIQLQAKFLQVLTQHQPPIPHYVPQLLKKIVDCDEDLLEFTLGSVGQKLHGFVRNIDFDHPEIITIFDGALSDDRDFAQECIELLTLAKFAKEQDLKKIIPFCGNRFLKELPKNLFKKIDVAQNGRMHVRLLKNSQAREELRLSKKMQVIDLQGLFSKGEEAWLAQPDNFEKFLRFNKVYQEDVLIAEKKAARYDEMGCTSLALEIRRSIEYFKENMEEAYYGFNRITMTSAAIIMAKSLGFNYTQTTVKIPKNFFGDYDFDRSKSLQYSPLISEAAGFPIFGQVEAKEFEYVPRVYPIHELSSIMPEKVKDTIALLEAFPDSGNKPIFDHFGVIVPGINFPNNFSYSFFDKEGLIHNFSCKEEAIKSFDLNLIKNDYICPIIVGEKDNKCYFICYFR